MSFLICSSVFATSVIGDSFMIQKTGFGASIEAAELNELFLWKKEEEAERVDREKLREELADAFAYAIMLAGRHGLDASEIVKDKISKNAKKYPVEKCKGIPPSTTTWTSLPYFDRNPAVLTATTR